MNSLIKKSIAELIGTAVLVFCACGVAGWTGGSAVATSLAFGLVIVAMAYSIGNVSGCHINPAVSLAMLIRKKITVKEFVYYVVAQVIGAFIGALLLAACLRSFDQIGTNVIQAELAKNAGLGGFEYDAWSYIGALLAEVVLTFIFVIAILGVTDSKFHDGKIAGIVIGLALVLVHLIGLGLTGTSVNPARSLAPSLLQAMFGSSTTSLQQVWIWILGPLAGGALAAIAYGFLAGNKEETKEEVKEETKAE